MDLLDDVFVEPSAVKAPVRTKFQPKAKPRPKKGAKEQPISSALANSDSDQLIQPNQLNKNLDFPNSSSTETAGTEQPSLRRCNLEDVLADGNLSDEVIDVVDSAITGHSEIAVSNTSGDGHLAGGASLGSQGPKDTISQLATAAEGDTSGFPDVALASPLPCRPCDAHGLFIPSTNQESEHSKEIFFANGGDFQIDMEQETVDFSFLEAVDITSKAAVPSGNRAVKFQPKPRAQSSRQTNSAQVVSHVADVGEVPSENQHINGDELIHVGDLDDVNYGIQFDSSSPARALSEPASNSDKNNDDNHLEEETAKKKRLRNSKKVSSENDKPSKKRMMEAEALEEPTEKPRKRFPHATRRKRSVDKSLLEAPEGETDLRTVPIRDLIILADYRDRQAKKQAPAVQPSLTNERSENTLQEDPPYDEDETYGSDQDTGSLDNPSTSRVIKDTGYFNYQSFSDQRNRRWSKHETELFYQGIQEFGPDFTMIQQRYFPERSRHQVKLKYKKEEHQCPMRIHDALTNRPKDLSHFEVLIQKLQEQEQAAREEEDEGGDEETHETHETANPEENGRSAALNQESDNTAGVASPAKSNDNEDEFDWNEYKSEL